MNNYKNIKLYYICLLTFTTVITIFGSNPYDNHGTTIMMIFGAPIFFILYRSNFVAFSDKIEKQYPELFKKYCTNHTVVQRINDFSLFNNGDFDNLEDEKLRNRLFLVKKLFWLTLLSFFTAIAMGVLFIWLKR